MGGDSKEAKEGLPEDFFEMEIISNMPNNVELNRSSSK